MKLAGKKALITGGATGIGRGIADAFAREGADIAINYFGKEEEAISVQKELAAEYGVTVVLIEADITDENQVEEMITTAVNELGRIDILVNSAGILNQMLLKDMTVKDWDQMIKVNLRGPFLCTKSILPHMLKNNYGRIINIASQLGQIGGVELSHYCAAKAGVIGFTKSVAREVGQYGININCIAPGPIETSMIKNLDHNWKEQKGKSLPIPRFGLVEEVAPTAVMLASDPDGNLYTGQTLGPNSGDVML
ncbi:SDR family oxidoreductase [Bacillus aerolatus]|uniref:SDR family oxidoreductase n=1 Tax=Bacillus aerolatus TaxID=2653354 RepID=A0A6I1FVT2_9BACI|nr:3-oxoacyl-ACP reductase family protein [Bacillus aerolatus]KAB7707081.1 SDR family oxidoreductase [Bacillus aerolatus]